MSTTSSPTPATPPAADTTAAPAHGLSHIEAEVVDYAKEAFGWGEKEAKMFLVKIAALLHAHPAPASTTTAASAK